MLCSSHIKIWNLANHMKKQNKNHQNAQTIDEKRKIQSLMFFVSFYSCDLQDFKFQYVNRKAFGTSFCYWVDFKCHFFDIGISWTSLIEIYYSFFVMFMAGTLESIVYHLAKSICFSEFTQKRKLIKSWVCVVKVLEKNAKIDTCSAQNVLDPLLSLHVYIVIPEDLL